MNNIPKRVQVDGAEIELTPMLDVVFIVLVFFVVTATFNKEAGISLNYPDSAQHSEPLELQPILVKVSALSEISIQERIVNSSSVRALITRLLIQTPEASVAIKVCPTAKTKVVIAAVDGVRGAKVNMPAVTLDRGC